MTLNTIFFLYVQITNKYDEKKNKERKAWKKVRERYHGLSEEEKPKDEKRPKKDIKILQKKKKTTSVLLGV